MSGIKDYAKCVLANKFTLAGYAFTVSSYPFCSDIFNWLNGESNINFNVGIGLTLISLGAVLLSSTEFGVGTYDIYERTKKHIAGSGNIGNGFAFCFSSVYCDKIGLKLAAKEAGLEHLIK